MTDAAAVLTELEQALQECRFRDVRAIVDGLDPVPFDAKQAARVLKLLRRKRRFEELATAADVFSEEGHNEPVLRRLRSQALIDQGLLFQGLSTLRRLAPKVEDDAREGPEVRGLIGRAHKQTFVDEAAPEALTEAIAAYEIDGRQAPGEHRWHGINLVACIKRARREGIAVESQIDPDALARSILDTISAMENPPVWDLATAQEAAVALGERQEALKWLTKYAKHDEADAFELGSTLRQLKEIWQLEGTDLGGAILPVLEYELIHRTGGTLGFVSKTPDSGGFEAVYGKEAAKSLQWLDSLRERCESIGRVYVEVSGAAQGTGFFAKGSWFHEDWGDDLVFVTNNHVISTKDGGALEPDDAMVEFTRLPGRPRATLGALLFESIKEQLDVSILRIEPPEGSKPIKLTPYVPTAGDDDDAARVYVAGHPDGRELEVTLYDNELREVVNPFARYRSPTEGGNSGSPVMNGKWKAFALHHRAVEEKQLNEGVLFDSIREAIRGGAGELSAAVGR